jgi:hypothetical protein
MFLITLTFFNFYERNKKSGFILKPLFGYCLVKIILLGKVGKVLANDK